MNEMQKQLLIHVLQCKNKSDLLALCIAVLESQRSGNMINSVEINTQKQFDSKIVKLAANQ